LRGKQSKKMTNKKAPPNGQTFLAPSWQHSGKKKTELKGKRLVKKEGGAAV